MRRFFALIGVLAIVWASAPAIAVEPDEILSDAKLEARARSISSELRCLVCQNQSIDDSNAPLARDLRVLVRERLKAGDSDDDVMRFVVARYGDFVLLRPRFTGPNVLLWLAPPIILAIAVLFALRRARGGRPQPARPLDAAEQARLEAILDRRNER
jgi:cytochrome c-type biogenesis protein CcmH